MLVLLPRVAGEHHEAHGDVFFGGGVGDGAERLGFGVGWRCELRHGGFPVALGSLASGVSRLCFALSVFRIRNPEALLRILP